MKFDYFPLGPILLNEWLLFGVLAQFYPNNYSSSKK